MAIFKVKPDDGNHLGRPRLYFCCHPEDFSCYFKEISDEILDKVRVSFWYSEGPAPRDEEYLSYLQQMQLFVLPVTHRLLTTANDALRIDFRFAEEHHIPILPLMLEPGLDELFNEKCGNLQFLDRSSTDATAIAYEEKLTKYLDSILVRDQLAQRIRDAFDAYIFLSYRKKDRKHARELMSLIHEHDFCRDVAIWYDEFLLPGEDFNDSIKEALIKSDLFLMAVTPNLVNETNYIMTIEYPMAKREEKKILPVELLPTDRDQLTEIYYELPPLIDAHNSAEFSEALRAALRIRKERDVSPEQDYLMGMAYLGGVDVEVNHKIAVSRITTAAEAGVVEAANTLFNMYLNGNGVPRDYAESTRWLCYKVQLLRKKLMAERTEKNYIDMISALYSLADHHVMVFGNRSEAKQVYLEQNMLCEKAYQKFPTYTFRRLLGSSYTHVAQAYLDTREYALAEQVLEKANKLLGTIREEQMKEMGEDGIQKVTIGQLREYQVGAHDLASMYGTFAEMALQRRDFEKAEEYLLRALQLRQEVEKHFKDDPILIVNIAGAYLNLAQFYYDRGKYQQAADYCEKGYPLALDLANQTGYLPPGELSIRIWMIRGNIYCQENELKEALACYITNLIYLQHSKRTPQMERLMAENQYEASRICYLMERYKVAASYLADYLKTTRACCSQKEYAAIYERELPCLTDCYIKGGDKKTVMQIYYERMENAVKDYEERNNRTGFDCIQAILEMGDVATRCGYYDEAHRVYKMALRFSKLAKIVADDEVHRYLGYTVTSYLKMAALYQKMEDGKRQNKVKKAFLDAIKIGRKALKYHRSTDTYSQLASAYAVMGDWYKTIGQRKLALKCYTKGIWLAEESLLVYREEDDKFLLASLYLLVSAIAEKNGEEMLKKSQKLLKELLDQNPTSVKYQNGMKMAENVRKELYPTM